MFMYKGKDLEKVSRKIESCIEQIVSILGLEEEYVSQFNTIIETKDAFYKAHGYPKLEQVFAFKWASLVFDIYQARNEYCHFCETSNPSASFAKRAFEVRLNELLLEKLPKTNTFIEAVEGYANSIYDSQIQKLFGQKMLSLAKNFNEVRYGRWKTINDYDLLEAFNLKLEEFSFEESEESENIHKNTDEYSKAISNFRKATINRESEKDSLLKIIELS